MKITFPNGDVKEFPAETTGMQIAESISPGLARNAVGIVADGTTLDLTTPITTDATVRILTFSDDEGKQIFWHSSAHLLAEALQELYPGIKFTIGPPIENGFYYDVLLPDDRKISPEDFETIENKMKELSKKNSAFQRIDVSWEDAVDMYKKEGNEFKLELLDTFKGQDITLYRQGDFLDLCRGTHVPTTGMLKFAKVLSVAGAYWRGDSDREMLTRVYGVSYPKKQMLEEDLHLREEAEKRDHRKLGKQLELYTITQKVGSGLPIWLPNGTMLRRTLEQFLREMQITAGYQEVITPHIGHLDLYRTSGHYPYYSESQYSPIQVDDEEYLLKPMNCPHHHQIYASKPRSYRDLPVRLAEFGSVYRYEQSGELNGISRTRGFTQDDSHIYCTPEQIKDELKSVVNLTQIVFRTFGLEPFTRLSFRDDDETKYAGDPADWERGQRILKEVADEMELDYVIGEGEAAFYGPKIDFIVRDALGRKWQLGTVQIDYVMPERFELEYVGSDNAKHRPVIIHRAPFGSMERFISILIEHYAGNFPFWLAPVQATVLPITDDQADFAQAVHAELEKRGVRATIDTRSEKIGRKIAEAEQAKIPFSLIIGAREKEANSVALREHTVGDRGKMPVGELYELLEQLSAPGATEHKSEESA